MPEDNSKKLVKKLYMKDGTVREIPIKVRESVEHKKKTEAELLTSPDGRTQAAVMRRSEFVRLLSQGMTPSEVCRSMDIALGTYYTWRKRLPNFRHQCDLAQQDWYNQIKSEDVTNWSTFAAFRKRFFKMDTYYPHAQIIESIESAQSMEVVLILVAPETGKTTLLEDKIGEILARDPDHRIAYISESTGHSRKVGSRIRRRMTDTAEFGDYIAKFGPFFEDGQEKEGKSWTTEHFTVFKASHDERDYSFEARGAMSNIQGSRVDTLFIDDIQSLKSLGRTKDLLTKFRQEWITRVGKAGRTIIIGTRVDLGDIYEHLIEQDLIDRLVEIPILNSDGKSIVPELWSEEDLIKRRKQVGEQVWFRTYMQDPLAAGNTTFDDEVIDAFKDSDRTIGKEDNKPTVMSVDPAIAGGCSFTVAQYTASELKVVYQVTDYEVGRTEPILARVDELASVYKPQDFIIEMMAFQQALGKDDRMLALGKKHGFRIYPHTTSNNKYDQAFGVGSMATSMRAGEMTIPWGDERAQGVFQPLIDEMRLWRPNVRGMRLRQDRVMSLWFIHLYWMNQRNVVDFQTKKAAIKARALPWQPTHLRRRIK